MSVKIAGLMTLKIDSQRRHFARGYLDVGCPHLRPRGITDTQFGSHNMGYVMRANSSALTLRLVWQSSLATLPFWCQFAADAVLTKGPYTGFGGVKWQNLVRSVPSPDCSRRFRS